jgi:two-component system OmpR family response regulator
MLPKTLALVDDDVEYVAGLARYLRENDIDVVTFADSNDLLAHPAAYTYDFYVTDLMLPGVDGVHLIDVLRRRTNAGVVVVSGRLGPETFRQVITAGADMYLSKPVQFEQILLAIQAVCRRSAASDMGGRVWRLDRRLGQLIAPDGACVDLSDTDRSVIECFVEAQGEVVPRDKLLQRLGRGSEPEAPGGLNATIFRLRRRIERATPATVPLQTKSGVGYAFRAPLKVV